MSKPHRTIVAGIQQMDGTWKHFKNFRPMPMLHKKNQQVHKKKVLLGLELDMASLCRLVGVCGRCVAKKHSGTEASRRGKKWMGGCLPRMIENHDF